MSRYRAVLARVVLCVAAGEMVAVHPFLPFRLKAGQQ
jgi:hypothetical protein